MIQGYDLLTGRHARDQSDRINELIALHGIGVTAKTEDNGDHLGGNRQNAQAAAQLRVQFHRCPPLASCHKCSIHTAEEDGKHNLTEAVARHQLGEEMLCLGQIIFRQQGAEPVGKQHHVAMTMGGYARISHVGEFPVRAVVMHQQDIFHSIGHIVLDNQSVGVDQIDDFGKLLSDDAKTIERSLADRSNHHIRRQEDFRNDLGVPTAKLQVKFMKPNQIGSPGVVDVGTSQRFAADGQTHGFLLLSWAESGRQRCSRNSCEQLQVPASHTARHFCVHCAPAPFCDGTQATYGPWKPAFLNVFTQIAADQSFQCFWKHPILFDPGWNFPKTVSSLRAAAGR